ncbi:MAG: TonB-dependent receptor [Methylobacillus glycogenes]|nr:TonB-dependent receptor [Methylobacillus glycogenes]
MSFRLSAGAAALASIFSLPSLYAAELQVADTVVTASRTEQQLNDVIGDVSVISEEQILKAGQTSLVELLAMQAGIEVSHNGGVGKSSNVYIRGANPVHTVVLLDGMRINSATSGTTSLENIPLNQIERVEILRGPASSLYGADAIGGVIQIFTKSANGKPRINATVGLGTYGTAMGSTGISGRVDNTSFSLQAGLSSTNGVSAIANKRLATYNPDDDGYDNRNLSFKLAQHFNERHEIGISGYLSEGTNYYDGGALTPLNNPRNRFNYYSRQRQTLVDVYSKNRFTDNWLSTLRIGQSQDDSTAYSPNTTHTRKTKSVYETVQTQYLWQNDIVTKVAGTFTLGAERREQKIDSTSTYVVDSRDIQSGFAGWQGKFGAHSVQVTARNDDNSQFGNKTTGGVGYAYQLTRELRARANWGTAFSAPTFNQLYSPLALGFIGNANLKPEEANNRELGLQFIKDGHQLNVSYYHNRVSDLIVNTRTTPSVLTPVNISNALLRGLTLSYQGQLAGFNILANADFQRPEDQDTGNLLVRRAKQNGNLGISRQWGDLQLGTEIETAAHRYNDVANLERMSGYTLVNLYSQYRINNDWSLNARVNNLFDRKYELAKDYGTLGTNLFVSVRYAPTL